MATPRSTHYSRPTSGTIAGGRHLFGADARAQGGAAGELAHAVPLAGSGQGAGSVSVSLAHGVPLAAAAAAQAAAVIALAKSAPLGGAAVAAGAATGNLSGGSGGGGQPEAPTSGLTTFTVTSANAGQQPFTVGHAFRQGDIPSGSTLTGLQCSIKNAWPDGSVKFAVLSGYATLTSNVARTVGCQIGTAPTGSALTTANLKAALTQTVTMDAGAFGSASWIGTDWDTPFQTWVSGPLMSSWLYRKPIGADAHLVAWLEVRLWSSGAVEVFPWVEVCNLLASAAPTNKNATYTFTMGGTQRFSAAINVKALTRIPLLPNNGTTFSHWLGTDPQVTPKHDRAYVMSTGLVPKYIGLDPTGTVLDSLFKTYVINDATAGGQISTTMSDAGGRGSAFESGAAMYLKSDGDIRGYRAMMANALSSGAWSIHHRDPTNHYPIKFSDYPNIQIDSGQGTPAVAHETNITGGVNGTSSFTHLPSYGYGPYLFTGRYWFFDEVLMWVTSSYIYTRTDLKQNAKNLIDPNAGYFDRGAAWAMTGLWHALALCPTDHPLYNDLKTSLEANLAHYRAKYVEGTSFSGQWVNPMGWMAVSTQYNTGGEQASNDRRAGAFQDAYLKLTLGLARNAGLPLSVAAQLDLLAVTNQGYRSVAQRASDGAGSNPNWRHLTVFEYAISNPWGSTPPGGWLTAAQAYASWLSWNGVSAIPGTAGLSIKDSGGVTDLNSASGSIVYFDVYHDTLALASEHGAAGAPAGFALVQGASNYASLRDNYMKGGNHPWGWAGMGPRSSLPFTLPGAGQAVRVDTNNTFYDVKPSNVANGQWDYPIFGSYGGHTFNPDYSTLGSFVAGCAGGHSHPDYIGVVGFDLTTCLWYRQDPTNAGALPYRTDLSPYAGSSTSGAPWWELNGMTDVPCPGHNYGQRNWLPRAWGGGIKGGLLVGPRTGVTTDGQQSAPVLHKFDQDTRLWSRASAATTLRAQSDSDTVIDVRRRRYWIMTKNDDTFTTIQYVDADTWALNSLQIPAAISGSGYRSMFRGFMLTINAAGLYLLDPDLLPSATTGWIALNRTGALPSFPGGRMAECRGKLYYRDSTSTNNIIHRITPPSGDLKTGTWAIDTVTLNISLPAVAVGLPHHAQLMHVPALDLLMWVTAAGVYLIRPE